MNLFRNIIFNTCFALNCLLIFLVLMEHKIAVPPWLQVAGRLHPALLHFPIALLIISAFWFLMFEKKFSNEGGRAAGDWLLLLSAFTSVVTALAGLFLSREEGYEANILQWHKWGGVITSVFAAAWYVYRNGIRKLKAVRLSVSLFGLALIIFTGHKGAVITHGENFLLAPVTPEKPVAKVLFEDAYLYKDMVQPILQGKCMSCHNSRRAKGDLIMETEELLLKGGKSGKLWDIDEPGFGLLLERLHLPEAAKKHMPPAGKPQLSSTELQVLYHWIKGGADFKTKVTALPVQDTLRMLAATFFNTIESDEYDFAAADEKKVQSLNTDYRVVYPLAKGSPALGVDFFGTAFYQPGQLEDLLRVKDQVVSLNMSRMPVKDDELKIIAQFINLRRLNLSFTSITGISLHELMNLKKLKQLSVSGTAVKLEYLKEVSALPSLTDLFIWNTGIKGEDARNLLRLNTSLTIETGYNSDSGLLKLTPPVLENETRVISGPVRLQLKHYISGVFIHYTVDGTDPDSIRSPVYNRNVQLNGNVTIRAKAFKKGWLSSDIQEYQFYMTGVRPDTIINNLQPDPQYRGKGNNTLADLEQGTVSNFKSGKWLGYRYNNMESVFIFNNPKSISGAALSTLIDIKSYIMPPHAVEIWGNKGDGKFIKIKTLSPQQPVSDEPAFLKGYQLDFPPVTLKSVKIIIVPVGKLPAWHPGRGDKGWVFIDEVFFN